MFNLFIFICNNVRLKYTLTQDGRLGQPKYSTRHPKKKNILRSVGFSLNILQIICLFASFRFGSY